MKKKQTVFVGLSGGVDSSVSAALLKQQGYEVVGVFMRTWHPDFLECNEEEERRDAMRVAAHLDIPFLTFDFEDVYKKEVGDYMIREYRAGRTPNPDVMCNKEVKFGAFLKKALAMGADFVATGHYAINDNFGNAGAFALGDKRTGNPRRLHSQNYLLRKGKDPAKDQSYFLWTLNQKQLSKILFPVGHLKKTQVRVLAKKFRLPVAEKKDSQGICFLGPVDLKEFLSHYIKPRRGKVLDENGKVIGWHDGAAFHTLGERHGFTVTKKTPHDKPYYIVGKDTKENILYASQERDAIFQGTDIRLLANSSFSRRRAAKAPSKQHPALAIEYCNWISGVSTFAKTYAAQIRYHGELLPCKVKAKGKTKAEIIFKKPVLVASGQSVVVYDKDVVLLGGVVV